MKNRFESVLNFTQKGSFLNGITRSYEQAVALFLNRIQLESNVRYLGEIKFGKIHLNSDMKVFFKGYHTVKIIILKPEDVYILYTLEILHSNKVSTTTTTNQTEYFSSFTHTLYSCFKELVQKNVDLFF